MKKIVRLTEVDLARMVKKLLSEQEEGNFKENDTLNFPVKKVMQDAYDFIGFAAPNGPRDKMQYSKAVDEIEKTYNYVIKNLRGNVPGVVGNMD